MKALTHMRIFVTAGLMLAVFGGLSASARFLSAQVPAPAAGAPGPGQVGPGGAAGSGGPGGPGGFGGGFGRGGVQADRPLVKQFDKDGDGRLNADERREARTFVESQGGGFRGRAGRGGFGGAPAGPVQPGPPVSRASVRDFPANVPFYDANTLRTLFLDFENADWEKELMAFKDTDVEVPATLVVDGTTYRNIGVSFRGASSFMMVPEGQKHSLNLTIDFTDEKQSVYGHRTLNLLNSHEDPSHLRTVLYLQAAREYVPAPRANFARVVINGESWGVYTNVEQFNKDFLPAWFKTDKGARWKVPGSPAGRGGLEYLGEDAAPYQRIYEIKSKDDEKDWAALVTLTKVLNETPSDRLEAALAPILDVDGALKFLALETVLVNNDGYWTRASDYSLYLAPDGRFHIIPHDANETFATGMGRGGRRGGFGPPPGGPPGDVFIQRGGSAGPGGPTGLGGPTGPGGPAPQGPAVAGVTGAPPGPQAGPGGAGPAGGQFGPGGGRRGGGPGGGGPLRSKLLAVPALRTKYLRYAREIATRWLDWRTLEPLVTRYQALIADDVKTDTRKLDTIESFETSAAQLKAFADQRRAVVLAATQP
jgi:spore coat protein CotH